MKAVIYSCTTAAEERDAIVRKVDEQERVLRAWAAVAGHEVVGAWADVGGTRAGVAAMLDSMARLEWEVVLVVGLDRLMGALQAVDVFGELYEAKRCALELPHSFVLPSDSELARLLRRVPAPAPRAPDPDLATRLMRGRIAGAKRGKHQSGPAPYGYRRDRDGFLVVLHEEAEVVRRIFREYLALRSMKKLLQALAGVKTRRGKEWSRAGLSWILRNDTYVGRVHFGAVRVKGKHQAIVSPIIFNKAGALMRKNDKRRRGREAKLAQVSP